MQVGEVFDYHYLEVSRTDIHFQAAHGYQPQIKHPPHSPQLSNQSIESKLKQEVELEHRCFRNPLH